MVDSKHENLKHNKALYEKRLIRGVPSKLFLGTVALVVITFVVIGFVASIAIFLIFIPPLIVIHKNDDQALILLFDNLKRPNMYTAGGVNEKKLKILMQQSNGNIEVKEIFKINNR